MKLHLLAAIAVLLAAPLAQAKSTYVHGYTKKDGSYVSGHYRSSPNNTSSDNWSTKGNYNPHTGAAGTKEPKENSFGSFEDQD